jgi:hypothetical protein
MSQQMTHEDLPVARSPGEFGQIPDNRRVQIELLQVI